MRLVKTVVLGSLISTVLLFMAGPASACCGNESDHIRVTRIFTIPGTDLYLFGQDVLLDYLGNGIGPEWMSVGADVPPSIEDRVVFDYLIYDAELRPLAGILRDLPRDYETGKPTLKQVYAKLGALPEPVEARLRQYQSELLARVGKRKKSGAPQLESILAGAPLEPASECAFDGRVKAGTLAVTFSDKATQNKLPVGEVSVASSCTSATTDEPVPVTVESIRCFADASHSRTLVIVRSHCDGACGGRRTDHAFVLSADKLTAMRENIVGYRAMKEKAYANAREHFAKSLALAPEYPHAIFNLACAQSQLHEDWRSARGLLERLLARPELRNTYREKIASDGDLDGWRKDPSFMDWVRSTVAKHEHATKVAKPQTLSASQARARTLTSEGMRLYRQKDWAGAALKFQLATDLDPSSVVARTNAASVYALLDDRTHAIEQLAAAMKLSKARTRSRMAQDHDYDALRGTAEFAALLAD